MPLAVGKITDRLQQERSTRRKDWRANSGSSTSIPELQAKGKGDDEQVWNRMVGRMRGAAGSIFINILTKHEVGRVPF
jgi:hypothetical protein